ncbi:hypothetical protein RHVG_00055 [Rhodovulum phage RS1]|uniref:hypothetical protein n=1 Tax=Rhodobacter phage RC1 TaxID=754055 RepID=UPI0002C18E56|nr:hypothetical protein RHWG_00002 [Rhodobacter phage RC1]YP_007676434.1 hypothetical protein RHVG_00055 [Rhodovulum phage RS1]AGH58020.1 hypothetical protein RHVG_00055 [Rhodovulum phage RS1]AGH58023.1 hypothetical protein RHWG_00002 [Rhodobacter phage RC1]
MSGAKTDELETRSFVDDLIANAGGRTVRIKVSDLLRLMPGEISGPYYQTLSELNADLDWVESAVALVWGDADTQLRGLYRKSGASGSGSWTRYADPPLAAVALADADQAAQDAASSANSATTKAGEAAASAQTASDASVTATTKASEAAASAQTASDASATATTKAGEAAASATSANDAAITATAKATAAANAQTAAEAARDQTLATFDSFDDRYLGAFAAEPTTDNDGNPLVAGALFYDTSAPGMKVYTGSAWAAAYISSSGVVLAANNLSDLTDTSIARTNLGLGDLAQNKFDDFYLDQAAWNAGLVNKWAFISPPQLAATIDARSGESPVVAASGTVIDFTGIPEGVNEVDILVNGLIFGSPDTLVVQLSKAGAFLTTGYSTVIAVVSSSTGSNTVTSGFGMAASNFNVWGQMDLRRLPGSDIWVGKNGGRRGTADAILGAGRVDLGGTLDGLRVTSVSGAAFAGGSVAIRWRF